MALPCQPHHSMPLSLPHLSSVCFCPTPPPRSACGRRPVCQQRGRSPHTRPLGQEGSPEGTPAQSGLRWDLPQRSGPRQEHPDQYLQKSLGLCDITSFSSNLPLYMSTQVTVWEVEIIAHCSLLSPRSHQAKTKWLHNVYAFLILICY